MPAYVIAIRERLRDPQQLEEYIRKASVPTEPMKKMKPLVHAGKQRIMEGPDCAGVMLFEFPTFADAEAWYDSQEYTEARKHRNLAADYRFMIVEGI